jgi:hypothetical protein
MKTHRLPKKEAAELLSISSTPKAGEGTAGYYITAPSSSTIAAQWDALSLEYKTVSTHRGHATGQDAVVFHTFQQPGSGHGLE